MLFIFGFSFVAFLILFLFFLAGKSMLFDNLGSSSFECGLTSYFFSRFSFSLHYYLIGLIFLFLDLELCYLLPFFNEDFSSLLSFSYFWIFMMVLILGLLEEWGEGLLDWKF